MKARAIGVPFDGTPGKYNAITDVEGVLVGYTTKIEGQGPLEVGKGPVRTGVTAILPRGYHSTLAPVWAGVHQLNGNGVMTGTQWIEDGGYFTSPIVLTNSHSVGIAHHATTRWMFEQYEAQYRNEHVWSMPVVAETYDGVTNDINGLHVQEKDVLYALRHAQSGSIAEGNVGGGTGMITYDFKGGSGTSSRIVKEDDRGSIIVIIATDAPLLPHQLRRLAKRATLGIGRTGTIGGNGSGDIFLAFTTANEIEDPQVGTSHYTLAALNDEYCDPLYAGAVEATEEAIINAMTSGETMASVKPEGTIPHLDHEQLRTILRQYNRCTR